MSSLAQHPLGFIVVGGVLEVTFLPNSVNGVGVTKGIKINGEQITYRSSNTDSRSNIKMFTSNSTPFGTKTMQNWPFAQTMYSKMTTHSGQSPLPKNYFLVTQIYFGGCGCDSWIGIPNEENYGAAFGFFFKN